MYKYGQEILISTITTNYLQSNICGAWSEKAKKVAPLRNPTWKDCKIYHKPRINPMTAPNIPKVKLNNILRAKRRRYCIIFSSRPIAKIPINKASHFVCLTGGIVFSHIRNTARYNVAGVGHGSHAEVRYTHLITYYISENHFAIVKIYRRDIIQVLVDIALVTGIERREILCLWTTCICGTI